MHTSIAAATAHIAAARAARPTFNLLAEDIAAGAERHERTRALIAEDMHRARAALDERDSQVAQLDQASRRHDLSRRFTGDPLTGWGVL